MICDPPHPIPSILLKVLSILLVSLESQMLALLIFFNATFIFYFINLQPYLYYLFPSTSFRFKLVLCFVFWLFFFNLSWISASPSVNALKAIYYFPLSVQCTTNICLIIFLEAQFFNFYHIHLHVCGEGCVCHDSYVELRGQLLRVSFSPSTMQVPGIRLRSSDLAVSTLTHWAIFPSSRPASC